MKKNVLIIVALLSYCFSNAQDGNKTSFTIGDSVTFGSKILSEKRTLNVYLPEGYNSTEAAKYPVIYLLDGTANEDFLHVVGLVQFFNLQFNMPKTIVVGIANVDRKRDFTFYTELEELKKEYPTTGHSDKFINFIATELQPYIESHYNVSNKKYLIGQSLGGLLASEILLKKPDLFTNYTITSPSLWWDNESLLKIAPELLKNQQDNPISVYVAVGKEGSIMEKEAKGLVKALETSGKKNIKISFKYFPDENHATILHNSIYQAFLIEFPYKEPK